MRPRPGLSIPAVTVLDAGGDLLEQDQRSLVRFLIQDGYGADILFAGGTTGEWDRLPPAVHRRAVQICAEETAKVNASLPATVSEDVELWAGITAHTPEATLTNLDSAIDCGADAAVLAPLSIRGLEDPVRFVTRDIADFLDARSRRIPIFLYDNADIAIDPKAPHIRTRHVKAMSRLDFIRGIKVSASKKDLGNYTKAAENFRQRGDFVIYVGNGMLIFDLFRPQPGFFGAIAEHWNQYRLRGSLPVGVVSGHANALPREWQRAWQVCQVGDLERMEECREIFETFRVGTRNAGGKRTLACLKRALCTLGVITSDRVAPGTPVLTPSDAARFDEIFETVRTLVQDRFPKTWVTRAPRT